MYEDTYGDTDVIRALAASMEEQASRVREEARALVAASTAVLWDGRAAEAMRDRMAERASRLVDTAEHHDEAARLLRVHADRVERAKRLIETIAERWVRLANQARERLEAASQRSGALMEASVKSVVRAGDEALLRFSPPPPGHRDWLAVPDLFRTVWG